MVNSERLPLEVSQETLALLGDSLTAYHRDVPAAYDEVLHEVCDRIRQSGSIGKTDIGALLFWKRLRANTPWVSALMRVPETDVRAVTAVAVAAVTDESLPVPVAASARRGALSRLPGFEGGDALASALLMAAAPDRMAVYDSRAQRALSGLQIRLTPTRGRYSRYMAIVEDLRGAAAGQGVAWTARDVDLALYQLGG